MRIANLASSAVSPYRVVASDPAVRTAFDHRWRDLISAIPWNELTTSNIGPRRRAVAADFVNHGLCCAHHIPKHALFAVSARPAAEWNVVAAVCEEPVRGRRVRVVWDRPAKELHLLVLRAHYTECQATAGLHLPKATLILLESLASIASDDNVMWWYVLAV
jgi:hypothetical protein